MSRARRVIYCVMAEGFLSKNRLTSSLRVRQVPYIGGHMPTQLDFPDLRPLHLTKLAYLASIPASPANFRLKPHLPIDFWSLQLHSVLQLMILL